MDNTEKNDTLRELKIEVADLQYKFLQNEIAQASKRKEKKWYANPLLLAVITAVLGIIANFIINIWQQNAHIKNEKLKLKNDVVLKALDAGDTSKVAKTLLWLVEKKLLEDDDSSLTKAALNPSELPVFVGFNADPTDMSTLSVSNFTQDGGCETGPVDGCWKNSITAFPGDTIAIQIYFHNASTYLLQEATLGLRPMVSSKDTNHIFIGGIASTTVPRSLGYITVNTPIPAAISFIPGSIRFFKNGLYDAKSTDNENSLFGSGLFIGHVGPGWENQGNMVARFEVSNKKSNQHD